jgi:uncharacterized membrane protein (DUF4010 family)
MALALAGGARRLALVRPLPLVPLGLSAWALALPAAGAEAAPTTSAGAAGGPLADPRQVALGFAIALAVGGLIGMERERHARTREETTFGGARTFPLIALAGALAALASDVLGAGALLVGFLAVAGLVVLAYFLQVSGDARMLGTTSELAALITFALGALPFLASLPLDFQARLVLTGALGGVVMALLALGEPLHGLAERLSEQDLRATIRFLLLAVVALPLLPDASYGPHDTLNPFRVGVVVVLIAAISFVGYVAVRVLGARRGIAMTGLFGGLVSSSAVTLTFSQRARQHPADTRACALAVVLASTIMVPRVILEVAVLERSLVAPLAWPCAIMMAVGAAGCAVLYRRAAHREVEPDRPRLANPFLLRQALKLGAVFAVVRLVAALAYHRFGDAGLLVSAALAGIADVDAITLSIARMHASGLATGSAATAIVVATVTNTLAKAGLAWGLGGRRLGLGVGLVLVPLGAAGVATALVVR